MKQNCRKKLMIFACFIFLMVSAAYFALPLRAAATVKATVVDTENRTFELENFSFVVNGVGGPDIYKNVFDAKLSDGEFNAPFSAIIQILMTGSCSDGWIPVEFTFSKGEKETGWIYCYGRRLEGTYRAGKFMIPMQDVRKVFFAAGK